MIIVGVASPWCVVRKRVDWRGKWRNGGWLDPWRGGKEKRKRRGRREKGGRSGKKREELMRRPLRATGAGTQAEDSKHHM